MSDVFISYSRRDRPFVEQLRASLEAAKRSVWVDLRDIPPSADWRDEIHQAINGSDAIVCVLSPDYVASPICREEVEYAVASNKRLIPIVCRDIAGKDAPPSLAALNWIFFRDGDDLNQSLRTLVAALDADLPYLRSGTRLLVRAKEWETKGRNVSFTLRGKDLAEAEQWLASSGGKQPPPSQEQTQYIFASRRASVRRQRTTIGALTIGILITLTLSIISTALFKVTNDQNVVLRGHDIAGKANDALANSHLDQGLLLAVAASKQHDDFDTRNALLNGLDSAAYLDSVLIGAQPDGQTTNSNYIDMMYSNDIETLMALDSHNHSVLVWNGETHKLQLRITVPQTPTTDAFGRPVPDNLSAAALSPDGRFIATKSSVSGIRLWNATTGALISIVANGGTGDNTGDIPTTPANIRFSPNGRLLAWSECADVFCESEQIGLWDTGSGNLATPLPLAGTSILNFSVTLAFSPDSSLLAVGMLDNSNVAQQKLGGRVDIFHLGDKSLKESVTLASDSSQGQSGDVRDLAFSPDGSLLAIAGDQDALGYTGQVLFWNVTQRQFAGPMLRDTDGTITAEAFSPDGRYLVTGMGSGAFGLRVWSVRDRVAVTPILKAHTQTVNSIAFSANGQQFASSGEDGQALIWRLAPYSSLGHLLGDGFSGYAQAVFSPDGSLLATGSTNTVTLWDVKSGAKKNTLLIPPEDRNNADDDIGALAFSPDGRTLAAGDQLAQVILWNVSSGAVVAPPLQGHQQLLPGTHLNFVMDLSFSPDGSLLVSSGLDGQAILWDVATLTVSQTFTGIPARERQAAFSPDGRYLAIAGSDHDITIWDVTQESVVRTLKTGDAWVRALAFYPHRTATLAALDGNGAITTWDVSKGTALGQPLADGKLSDSIYSPHLVFDSTGDLLISSHDLSLTTWQMTGVGQGQKYVRALAPEYSQLNAALSPDGRYLAIATAGEVEVRYATVAGWRTAACSIANRELTQSEWQQFIPNTPYQAVC